MELETGLNVRVSEDPPTLVRSVTLARRLIRRVFTQIGDRKPKPPTSAQDGDFLPFPGRREL